MATFCSFLFVVVVSFVCGVISHNKKWATVKATLNKPIKPGEFCSGDAPDIIVKGKPCTATLVKQLSKNPMKGYNFSLCYCYDEDLWGVIDWSPADVDKAQMTDLDYIKKVVYKAH